MFRLVSVLGLLSMNGVLSLHYASSGNRESTDFSSSSASAGSAFYASRHLEDPTFIEKHSRVVLPGQPNDAFSYSGFITVNATMDSNMFYWFFPSQDGNANAPLVVWLQGGPGGSSLFGQFSEVGPWSLTDDLQLIPKPVTWNARYAMLFIDNPVGTGFSYTGSDAGYSNNMDDVAANLYSFLTQFFTAYPAYAKVDFYVAGESYAGKYIPAIGYKILQENGNNPTVPINLKGLSIGDGLCDPITQVTAYADFAFQTGLASEPERDHMYDYQRMIIDNIKKGNWSEATYYFNELVNAQYYPGYYTNISGSVDYYDIRNTVLPSWPDFATYVNQTSIRTALHVGDHYFQDSTPVYNHLADDLMKSVKPYIAPLLDNYKVMFYSGEFDFIVAATTTEAFIQSLDWKGMDGYRHARKAIWRVNATDVDVAGYARQYSSISQVIVRGAGHILPYNQPARAYDMIQRFIENIPF
eukprot:TRINITY_DN2275_c0_g1_i1.p1 TRINITY_DN2275_c0_g1~~TRINITY_DN2275_c0_g1_i1.p1  ORF type:complete len:469 (-),score=183.36 TRINITY_DN2275_c0_g1_i1:252-1658(-)